MNASVFLGSNPSQEAIVYGNGESVRVAFPLKESPILPIV